MYADTVAEQFYAPELSQNKTTIDSPTSIDAVQAKSRRADSPLESELPLQQTVALLKAARERLVPTQAYPMPSPIKDDELVIEIRAIGLNPVDWKSMYAFLRTCKISDMTDDEFSVTTTLQSLSCRTLQAAILPALLSGHLLLRVVFESVI